MDFDLLMLQQNEAQRRYSLIKDLLDTEITTSLIRKHSKKTGIRVRVLYTWVIVYPNKGIDALIPGDWDCPKPEIWEYIQKRRAELGTDVEGVEFSQAHIVKIAARNDWSPQKAKRWAVRFREGGLLALSPAKNPYQKKDKEARGDALGAVSDVKLDEAFERKSIIKPLLNISNDQSITEAVKSLSKETGIGERTLWYWLRAFRARGVKGLVPQKRTDCGKYRNISPEMVKYTKSIQLTNPGWQAGKVYEESVLYAKEQTCLPPSLKQVRSIIDSIPPGTLILLDGRLTEFKNRFEFTSSIPKRGDRVSWQIDTTKIPVMIKDLRIERDRNLSEEVRCFHISVIDARSRKSLANTLWYEESDRHCVATTIRDAIIAGGIPHEIIMDRGRDYMAKHVTQLLDALEIDIVHLDPHQPQQKGVIERFFKTIETRLWANQPGYVRKIYDRSDNLKATLNIYELETILKDFIQKYNHEKHKSTQRIPSEMYDDIATKRADPQELDLLLLEPKRLKVWKDGIHHLGKTYHHPDLMDLIGEEVVIRARPTFEKPDFVVVYHNEVRVCIAYDRSLTRTEVRQAKIDQKAKIKEEFKKAKEFVLKEKSNISQETKTDDLPSISSSPNNKKTVRTKKSKKGSVLKRLIQGRRPDKEQT